MATEQMAQNARAEAGAVAGTLKEETKNVAQEAQQQAADTLHQVQNDMRTRANEEAGKVAQTLHSTSRQLQSMAGATDQQDLVARLTREGANAAERIASRLDQGGFDAIMADLRSWARRQPGTFLLGALAAGFVTGRLVRNLAGDEQAQSTSHTSNGYGGYPEAVDLRNGSETSPRSYGGVA